MRTMILAAMMALMVACGGTTGGSYGGLVELDGAAVEVDASRGDAVEVEAPADAVEARYVAADASHGDAAPVDAVEVEAGDVVEVRDAAEVEAAPAVARDACSPSCGSRACGDDGCGGSCGSCGGVEVCRASGVCMARSLFVLVAVSGTVARLNVGDPWDDVGGPDPYVCITLNGARRCSSVAPDTYAPAWLSDVSEAMTAERMQTYLRAGWRLDFADSDAVVDDGICRGPMTSPGFVVVDGAELNVRCDLGTLRFRTVEIR